MASKTLEQILTESIATGKATSKSKASIVWFKKNLSSLSNLKNIQNILDDKEAKTIRSWTNTGIGSMYFVHYNPKHKETLKYYDNFPLVIPIEKYNNGILGLNLHYLPPVLRAKLLDALMETVSNTTLDENSKMKINYKILSSVARNKYFQPCIKRYLGRHFTSQFIKVSPSAWDSAIYMPVESFKKASKQEVWEDSKKVK